MGSGNGLGMVGGSWDESIVSVGGGFEFLPGDVDRYGVFIFLAVAFGGTELIDTDDIFTFDGNHSGSEIGSGLGTDEECFLRFGAGYVEIDRSAPAG